MCASSQPTRSVALPDADAQDDDEDQVPADQESASSGDASAPAEDVGSETGDDRVNSPPGVDITCFIYAPEYVPAILDVTVPLPMAQETFLRAVQERRTDEFVHFFPWLCPVSLQPDYTYVSLIAIPDWPAASVPILLSWKGPEARTFAEYVPAILRPADVLRLLGLPLDPVYRVYHGSVPWPLPEGEIIHVAAGDLLTVCPPDYRHVPGLSLHDILQWTSGWSCPEGPPDHTNSGTWILTDEVDCHAHVYLPSGTLSPLLLDHALGIDTRDHAIAPARPPICNHAHRACISTDVLIAALPAPRDPTVFVPFVLDLRPVLLPLSVRWAEHGRVDIAAIHAVAAARCPLHFCVRIYGGTAPPDRANHYRCVQPGDVLTVEFHPRRESPPHDPAYGEDDLPVSESPAPSDQHPSTVTSALSGPDAGTGSSTNPQRGPPDQQRMSSQTRWHPRGRRRGMVHKTPARTAHSQLDLRPRLLPTAMVWCLVVPIAQAVGSVVVTGKPDAAHSLLPCTSSYHNENMWPLVVQLDSHPFGKQGDASVTSGDRSSGLKPFASRPIPTPCRALRSVPDRPDQIVGGIGPTLLEEAMSQPQCQAFFLASTLLETLTEHFGSVTLQAAVPRRRKVVTLSKHLPLTRHQQASLTLRDIIPQPASGDFADWLDNDLGTLLAWDHLPDTRVRQFLAIQKWHAHVGIAPSQAATLQEVHIYTDGSASTTPADLQPCSWAFTVWCCHPEGTFFYGGQAHRSFAASQLYHVGEMQEDSLTGELLALLWAFAWIAQYGPALAVPITVFYDAISVGMGAFGESSPPAYPRQGQQPSLPELIVSVRQCAESFLTIFHRHVSGHSGVLGNELADCMAKHARRLADSQECCLPAWPAQLYRHPLWAWAWTLAKPAHDTPTLFAMESEADRLRAMPRATEVAPNMGLRKIQPPTSAVKYCLVCITFNVLTLRGAPNGSQVEAGLRFLGRRAILMRELASHQPTFVGLQETRLPDTAQMPDKSYFIFNAAATDRGQLGCALWVSKDRPYAVAGSQKFFFCEQHFVVVGYSPRHIAVSVQAPHLRLLVLVVHCPSLHNHPRHVVEQFWQDPLRDLRRRPTSTEYLILADANAEVGSVPTESVGPFQAADETPAGTIYHDFLLRAEAFLPATHDGCHSGCGTTWRSTQGYPHRIDYVIVPQSWRHFCLQSVVLTDLEALQLREDHTAVKLTVEFCRPVTDRPYVDTRRKAVRPPMDADPATVQSRRLMFHQLTTVPWHASVDQQYEGFVQAWTTAGRNLSVPTERKPEQPFLTEATLQLVQCCKALRHYLRAESQERCRRVLIIAFAALVHTARGTSFTAHACRQASLWLWELDYSEATAAFYLRGYTKSLRAHVKADRLQYLQGLVDHVTLQDLRNPARLYQAVRRAFPSARSARRSALRPLPAVLNAEGELAATPFDKAGCWRKHFSAQEAGLLVDQEGYIDAFNALPKPAQIPLDMQSIPDMASIERIILQLKRGKAAGPDAITADLLRLAPPEAARQLMPIFLKASLSLREPIEFRGGTLICLAKKVGAALQCSQFRSILVSSVPAKIYHRHLRTQLLPTHASTKPALQAGALGGVGIEAIALAARSFQSLCQATGQLWSLLFVDVQAAFYRVIRETLYRTGDDDAGLLSILQAMKLPPHAVQELHRTLSNLAVLSDLGASEQVQAQIQDAMQGTWFRIDAHELLTWTRCGTRPGDPAADILFALSFSVFLHRVQCSLGEKELLPDLGSTPQDLEWTREMEETASPHGPIILGAPAWADDFFLPQQGSSRPNLLCRTRRTMECTLALATSIGMKLTFASDKTAVLLPSGHDWTLLTGAVVDQAGYPGLEVEDPVTRETHVLPIVQTYKHLGGILTARTTTKPDILFRQSRAMSVIKPLRRQLFASAAVPIVVRRSLLKALALSRLVHTSAALILPHASAQRTWDRAYLQVQKALLSKKGPADHQHSYLVLLAAEAPPPPLALAKARASFLMQLTRNGPTLLCQLLVKHWRVHPASSWLAQLEEDVAMVTMYCPQATAPIQGAHSVLRLLDSLVDNPRWWLCQVKKAIKQAHHQLEKWRLLRSKGVIPESHDVPPASMDFPCSYCAAAFPLRKHLGAHMAKSHGVWSPARHFALDKYCHACLRWYGSVQQVQLHLKRSDACLLRLVSLFPPLTKDQVRQVEAPEVIREHKLRQGQWTSYRAVAQTLQVFGPPMPTAAERVQDMDFYAEDLPIVSLRAYRPTHERIQWIQSYIAARSTEGPRTTTRGFWHRPPCMGFTAN